MAIAVSAMRVHRLWKLMQLRRQINVARPIGCCGRVILRMVTKGHTVEVHVTNNRFESDKKASLTSAGKTWKIAAQVNMLLTGIALTAPLIAANVSWVLSGFQSSPMSAKDHGVFLLFYIYTLPAAIVLGLIAAVCFAFARVHLKKL